MKYKRIILILLIFCISCAGGKRKAKLSPPPPLTLPPPQQREPAFGSLWREGALSRLFSDHIARDVGDIITIIVAESSSGSKESKTETSRESSASAGIPNFFGVAGKWFGSEHSSLISTSVNNSYEGKGKIERKEKLYAKITAKVIQKLPNGNLVIEGRREIILNGEKQTLYIRGIIRPEDISPDNTIMSEDIADAQIEYGGTGTISDKQSPGWLIKIFDWIWPF